MLYGIIRWIIISLILIFLVHHLFYFFKDTLTIPKVKDFVHNPMQQYKEIENTLNSALPIESVNKENTVNHGNNDTLNQNEMKNELKSFFNELNANQTINMQERNFAPY